LERAWAVPDRCGGLCAGIVCGASCAGSRYFDRSDLHLASPASPGPCWTGFVEAAMKAEPIKEAAPSGEVIVVGLTGLGPDILPLRVDGPPWEAVLFSIDVIFQSM
jgi:hypothetical protein